MLLSSAESRRASPSQRLLSRPDMQNEARKKYTTFSFDDQKNSNRQKSSSQHKNWGVLVLAPLLHSSEEKSFFIELGFGLTIQKMTTYSCRIGLVNPSAVSFTVRRELNIFEEFPVSWIKLVIPVSS